MERSEFPRSGSNSKKSRKNSGKREKKERKKREKISMEARRDILERRKNVRDRISANFRSLGIKGGQDVDEIIKFLEFSDERKHEITKRRLYRQFGFDKMLELFKKKGKKVFIKCNFCGTRSRDSYSNLSRVKKLCKNCENNDGCVTNEDIDFVNQICLRARINAILANIFSIEKKLREQGLPLDTYSFSDDFDNSSYEGKRKHTKQERDFSSDESESDSDDDSSDFDSENDCNSPSPKDNSPINLSPKKGAITGNNSPIKEDPKGKKDISNGSPTKSQKSTKEPTLPDLSCGKFPKPILPSEKIDEDDLTTKLSKIEKTELINDDRDIDELIEGLKQIRDSGNQYHINTTIFRKVKLPDRTK